MLSNPVYIPLIIMAVALVRLFRRRIAQMALVDRVVNVIDGIGVPSAIESVAALTAGGILPPGCVVVGVANSVGGGVRDLLVGDTPAASAGHDLRPSGDLIYASFSR